MVAAHQRSVCKKYDYLYYECKGHSPLTCGRVTKCPSRRVRADRLDAVVWQSLSEGLRTPTVIPQLHNTVPLRQACLTSLPEGQFNSAASSTLREITDQPFPYRPPLTPSTSVLRRVCVTAQHAGAYSRSHNLFDDGSLVCSRDCQPRPT